MTGTGQRVAVVGGVGVDLTVEVARLPGPGETVVGGDLGRGGGGKGGNAAVAAARAGADVLYIGAVGEDAEAEQVRAALEAESIDCAGLMRVPNRATAVALICVDPGGENQIAVAPGAGSALSPEWVTAQLTRDPAQLGCVLVSTEIPVEAVLAAVSAAAQAGAMCVLNPAPPLPGLARAYAQHPILTPNRTELAQLVDAGDPGDVAEQALALARRSQAAVLVTLGADGALIAESETADTTRLPAHAVEVVDATGAGDTVNGVLAARLAAGDAFAQAARTAILAGSLSTTAAGARGGMPTAAQLTDAGMEKDSPDQGR